MEQPVKTDLGETFRKAIGKSIPETFDLSTAVKQALAEAKKVPNVHTIADQIWESFEDALNDRHVSVSHSESCGALGSGIGKYGFFVQFVHYTIHPMNIPETGFLVLYVERSDGNSTEHQDVHFVVAL